MHIITQMCGKPLGRCPSQGQESSGVVLKSSAYHRLFKDWRTPIVDLLASSQANMVPQYIILDLSDKRGSGGDALKERWLEGLRQAFPPPNIIQVDLG